VNYPQKHLFAKTDDFRVTLSIFLVEKVDKTVEKCLLGINRSFYMWKNNRLYTSVTFENNTCALFSLALLHKEIHFDYFG